MLNFLSFILIIISLCIIRDFYTLSVMGKASDIIYKYVCDLSDEEYKSDFDYYNYMVISYNEYLVSFWKFGVKQCFKKEYRDILKKYIEE